MSQILHDWPSLARILTKSVFDADIATAKQIALGSDVERDFREAIANGRFSLVYLMWLVFETIFPEFGSDLLNSAERHLTTIINTVGENAARRAFRDKLLANVENTLEDVLYEIAATACACEVLDAGSVELEKPIPDQSKPRKYWKNSDICGTCRKTPIRIEVTVLHESLPPAIHMELDYFVNAAEISSGYEVRLRNLMADQQSAKRVRDLLELLHVAHLQSGGRSEDIDGVHFQWRGGAYHCDSYEAPIEYVCFHSPDDFLGAEQIRDIIHPCTVRNITPAFVREDYPNPPGVVTLADLPDAPNNVPVSSKVHQILERKLEQCESGIINIVAFGNPLPMHDNEIANAVRGAEIYSVPFRTEKDGVREFGDLFGRRDPRAPFADLMPPRNICVRFWHGLMRLFGCDITEKPISDNVLQFVEPFRVLSAVWVIRMGRYSKHTWLINPNAQIKMPSRLMNRLTSRFVSNMSAK